MANYDADEKECRCYLNGELVANFMLHCLDSVEMVGSIMQVNYHDEVEEDNTGEECIRYVLTDSIQSKNFLEVNFNDMNEYEKFYNQLDHSIGMILKKSCAIAFQERKTSQLMMKIGL